MNPEPRRVAILCPAASLRQTWQLTDRLRYDVTIGVNHACGTFPVHWVCACDLPTIAKLRAMPMVGIITPRNVIEALRSGEGASYWAEGQVWNPKPWHHVEACFWDDLTYAHGGTPCNFSAPSAVACAIAWGAQEVDLFSAEMRGTGGVDGTTGENRSDDRWQREARDLQAIQRRARDVRIRRILALPVPLPE